MQNVTATELARRLREILDDVEFHRKSVTIIRNKRPIARLLPGAQEMTARQAMCDLHGIVGDEAAEGWQEDRRTGRTLDIEMKDPWAT